MASPTAWGSAALAAATQPTRISLPSGPGSIEGLGRNFVPSLASGTAAYGIDIAVPPAAGGFAPKLSLDYDAGAGVSEVGLGFRISGLPSIRRRTEDGLPKFDETDAFELVGFGVPCDLVLMPDGFHRPQYESGSFARVQKSPDGATWEVRTKDGTTYRFGGEGFTEEEGGNVATYLLRESLDLHGHRIAFEWDSSEGYALLQSVTWNDFSKNVRQRIDLGYEARPDVHQLFSSGIKKRLSKRVRTIEVTLGGDLVRRYTLGYGSGERSLLSSVDMVGTDGKTAMPTLTLSYTEPSFVASGQTTRMAYPPYWSPANPNTALADLNGDGLPDLLVADTGSFHTVINHDGVTWKTADDWDGTRSPSLSLASTGVGLADLDGDGALDLFAKSGTDSFRYFPGWDAARFADPVVVRRVPSFTFEDPDVRLADMDGDRRPDVAITTAAGLAVGYNLGGTDWSLPEPVGRIDARQALRFSDGKTELCDVNGDRIQDICYLNSGSLAYWLGRGRGAFEPAQEAAGVPNFDASDPWRLVDLNGDGWVDLVHVGVTQVDYALAAAEGRFEAPRALKGTPSRGPQVSIQFADMNGSGTTDIVWIATSAAQSGGTSWNYLELFPDGRAGLLKTIENGLGKLTRITYATAAASAAAARDAKAPWSTRMNVATPVVAKVEVDDQLGDPVLVTEYSYGNGAWDPGARTFAGFGGGIQRELGDEFTPTLVTESTFDLGLKVRVLRGATLTSEQRDASGKVFSRTTSSYKPVTLGESTDGRAVEYAYKSGETVEHIEGLDDGVARHTQKGWEQDEFGNVTNESDWGEVAEGEPEADGDEAVTLRTFANNVDDWVLGRVASEELTDAQGTRASMKRYYYDGAAFKGLALGQVGRGNVSRVEAWVGPKAAAFQLVSQSRFDSHGNPVEVRDGRGGVRSYTWDAESFSRVVAESVNTGDLVLQQRAIYNPLLGTLETFVDFNGSRTSYEYDALGRVMKVIRPGDSATFPTKSYLYEIGLPLSRVTTELRLESGTANVATSIELVDGLGRKRATLAEDERTRWVLGDVALLDARGQARRTLYPRGVATRTIKLAELLESGPGESRARDALGRVVETTSELGLIERTEYAPFERRHWDGAQTVADFGYEQTPVVDTFDGLGRLVRVGWTLNGAAVEKSFVYDSAGRVLHRRDPEGNATLFGYDGRGRLIDVDEPDAGKNQFVVDAEGDVLERHHPDGVVTRYSYDLLGRPLTEDWDGDGAPEVNREYDQGGTAFLGLLASVSEPSGSTAFQYDERQRITETRHTIDGRDYLVGTRYDAQDRLVLHVYPDGSSVRLRRNQRGFLSGFGDDIVSFHYEADGREVRRDYATGVVEEFAFDDDRRPSEQLATDAAGRVIQHLRWTRDGSGNVTDIEDLRPHIAAERDLSAHYTFDNLYRLTDASGTWGSTSWAYSSNGNVVSRVSSVSSENAGRLAYGAQAGPNALSAIGKRKLQYDARGRLVDDGDRSYSWNEIDRLTRVKSASGASVESTFDAQGDRRIRVETDPRGERHTTHFIDPWSEVRDGKLARYLVHHGQRIVRLAEGEVDSSASIKQGALNSGSGGGHGARRAWTLRDVQGFAAAFPQLAIAFALVVALWSALGRASGLWRHLRLAFLAPVAAVAISCADANGNGSGRANGNDLPAVGSVRTLGAADEILLYDQIGSLTEVHRQEAPSDAVATYPYGTTRFDSGVRESRHFANAPRDIGVGVDIMGARAYVPELGAWASPDPALLDDPREYLHSHPSHSAYTYANSNPVALRDDNGEFAFLVAAGVFIGITFTAAKVDEPQSRAELAAGMAKLSAQAYATLSGARAAGTALAQGVRAAGQFVAQAVGGTVVGTATGAVKEKVVAKATEVSPALGMATDLALEAAPGMLSGAAPRKVTGAPRRAVTTETRIVSGATVAPKGRPALKGDVNVGSTLDRIRSGGSFPHPNDGSAFKNKEGLLPVQSRGYYQEWVHPTPGVSGPGPQRIVTGRGGELYYTPDHYKSFTALN